MLFGLSSRLYNQLIFFIQFLSLLELSIFSYRSSRPEVFCIKGVLRNFRKLTGKHLCQSLFFIKVAGLRLWWLLLKILLLTPILCKDTFFEIDSHCCSLIANRSVLVCLLDESKVKQQKIQETPFTFFSLNSNCKMS